MKKLIFVVNSRAGQMCSLFGAPVLDFVKRIEQELGGWDVHILIAGDPQELSEKLNQFSPDSIHAIFTVGGDGTLNRALDSLLALNDKGIPIGILPAGTANDFALSLGMELSIDCIARAVSGAPVQAIDVIRVNGLPLVTVGGTGIGSLLLDEVARSRQNRGRVGLGLMHSALKGEVYSLLAVKSILRGNIDPEHRDSATHRFRASASIDGDEPTLVTEFSSSLLFVCNQGKLGGNLHVSPSSSTSDGVFELMAHQAAGRMALLNAVLGFKLAKRPARALLLRARSLVLEEVDGRPITFFGDGEILLRESRLEFSIQPGALKVFRLTVADQAMHRPADLQDTPRLDSGFGRRRRAAPADADPFAYIPSVTKTNSNR